MRVIAGEFGGRRLEVPRGSSIRPTSDRAREALFSSLGPVEGMEVLDLFCGTGALGFEAISRGAANAVFVDTDTRTVSENAAALRVGPRAGVVRADAESFLASTALQFDLILCDPPYKLADRLGPKLQELVPARLREHGRLVVESPARAPIGLGESMSLESDRTYGEASLRIWEAR